MTNCYVKYLRVSFLLSPELPFSLPIKKLNIHPGPAVTYCSSSGVSLSTATKCLYLKIYNFKARDVEDFKTGDIIMSGLMELILYQYTVRG